MLGVHADEPLPDNAEQLLRAGGGTPDLFDNLVYGDFELCPFTRFRPGHMQFVCVARAWNLRLVVRQGH